MAETTVTILAGGAKPVARYPAPHPGGALLALDLGTTTGWALPLRRRRHHQRHGGVPADR